MSTYRVKTTYDQELADLVVLDPQPDPGPGVQTTRRTYSGDGSVYDEGRFVEFTWSAYTTAAAYQTLLGMFGLSATTSAAAVTVYVRDETYAWIRMNGNAIRPMLDKEVKWGDIQSRPLNIIILVRDLSPLPGAILGSDSITVAESAAAWISGVDVNIPTASDSITVGESAGASVQAATTREVTASDSVTIGESASAAVITP